MANIGRRNVALGILFSFLTLGVYQYYWFYQTLKNVKALKGDGSDSVKELLLLIFLPFYECFWWCTRGDALKEEFAARGYRFTGGSVLFLILYLSGLSFVALALVQNDFNAIPAPEAPAAEPAEAAPEAESEAKSGSAE